MTTRYRHGNCRETRRMLYQTLTVNNGTIPIAQQCQCNVMFLFECMESFHIFISLLFSLILMINMMKMSGRQCCEVELLAHAPFSTRSSSTDSSRLWAYVTIYRCFSSFHSVISAYGRSKEHICIPRRSWLNTNPVLDQQVVCYLVIDLGQSGEGMCSNKYSTSNEIREVCF